MKRTATSPLQSPRAFAHPRLFTSPRDEVIESSQACEIELQMPSFYQPRIRNTLIQDESIFDFGSSPPRRPSPPRRIQLSSDTEPDDGSSDSEENSVDVHEALFSYCTTGPAPPSPTPLQQGSQTESETEDESQIQVTEPQLAVEGPQMESMTEDESPQPIDILERSDSQCGASLAAILQGFDRDWESFQKIAFAQPTARSNPTESTETARSNPSESTEAAPSSPRPDSTISTLRRTVSPGRAAWHVRRIAKENSVLNSLLARNRQRYHRYSLIARGDRA